jgi:DNA-binding LacI/PurR family transcriptional regulator
MKKRLLSLLLAGLMTVGFVGCKATTEPASTDAKAPAATETTTKVEKYGKETIKIGFVNYDPTAAQFVQMQKYFTYLKDYVNVDFIYSEAIKSAEEELAFIESCAAAGAKAIIGYYNVSEKAAIQKAADLGMYYYGLSSNQGIYSEFKNNKFYLGAVDAGKSDYEGGYAMAKGLIDSGAKKLVLATGGKAFGVPIFVERCKGIEAAIKEANAKGADVKIVKEINGFPDEAFFAAQAEALAMDVDGVLATFNGAEIWMQPIQTAGKAGKVKISTVASVDDMYKAAFESGAMATLSAELVENFGLSIPMIVNAVEGDSDVIRHEDGTAANFPGKNVVINDKDTFMKYHKVETTGIWAYGGEDILKLIKGYNKDVKYADYEKLVANQDIETINARRGVK